MLPRNQETSVFTVFLCVTILMLFGGFVCLIFVLLAAGEGARLCSRRNIDLTTKKYFHIPGLEYDSWHINNKGYIYAKELVKGCKICFSMPKKSYFAFSAWDPENRIVRKDLPILLDDVLYSNGIALFERSENFCVVAQSKMYFKLQHSFKKPHNMLPNI